MRILFVHNNFPAQFRHLARYLSSDPSVRLAAIGSATAKAMPGVKLIRYPQIAADVSATHPFARRFDVECRRAEQVLYALSSLRLDGFEPDVILAHPGWGETLPLRTVFPKARIIVYCEFFYGSEGRDIGFDPEFPSTGTDGHVALHIKNASSLLALSEGDVGLSPTAWQRSTFPAGFHDKIRVIHDGIDVDAVRPSPSAAVTLRDGRRLTREHEVVTFVARNLEPLRGFHVFMRALPEILAARPSAQVVIVGGDGVSYGMAPPAGTSWRSILTSEIGSALDWRRVHFLGHLPYAAYLDVLAVSRAHVYLTYPFVLSWSMLEAMSCGCLVIGSDTPPVREVIDGGNGLLVPFFDVEHLADTVIGALAEPAAYRDLRLAARETIVTRYDLTRRSLPALLALVTGRTEAGPPGDRESVGAGPIRRAKAPPRVHRGAPPKTRSSAS